MNFLPMQTIMWLVVHCSATPKTKNMTTLELRHAHMLRGEHDIGYHYVIERDGSIHNGRAHDIPGAHASGYNRHSLGICLIGGRKGKTNKTEDNFTSLQKGTLTDLLAILTNDYEGAEVVGHSDLDGVTHGCPGFNVKEFWNGNTST
jgi:N-acetylmuramoyl-L-alanine amidase